MAQDYKNGSCPEWADPELNYREVIELENIITNPPPSLFPYPVYALAHSNLGGVLEEKGQLQEAKEHYLKAVAIANAHNTKDFVWPFRALAKLYGNKLDLIDGALQYFKVAVTSMVDAEPLIR